MELARKTEHPVVDDILEEMRPLIEDLSKKIAENVDETQGKASFSIKCELGHNKDDDLMFLISGKTTLSTVPIAKHAAIKEKQLSLW